MKSSVFLLVLLANSAYGFDYRLQFEKVCSYSKGNFPCEPSAEVYKIRQAADGSWIGFNSPTNMVELSVVKDDKHILILRNPVYFSGISLIHLMKRNGRFYWSETAYSDILDRDESTMRAGYFKLDTK